MNFWQDKRVIVTGGAGFLGSYVMEKLNERGGKNIFVPYIELAEKMLHWKPSVTLKIG